MLSRLRQLRDHARQELQLVDPLDVIPDVIPDVAPALLHTPTLLGMPAACPVVTIAGGTAAPVRIEAIVAPPIGLSADAVGSPRTTTLTWTVSTDSAVVGYNVYSKRADEPKLTLLAQVTGNSYPTADPWADAPGVPVRNYALAARLASGATSVLTQFVSNDDRDHDGLSDVDEARYGTNPDNPDTDGDGLKDGDEVAIGADPLNPDTDGDGYTDGLEVSRGSDPLSPASVPVALQAPADVIATASSMSQVSISWSAVAGAASYQVFRSSNHGPFGSIGTATTNSFADSTVAPATTYLYMVKAVDANNSASSASNVDLATTIVFTDDPLVAGSTVVKAAHIQELRTAVNAVRAAAGLPSVSFSRTVVFGVPIGAAEVNELRSSLDAARSALGIAPLTYPDAVLTSGSTIVRAVHISSLRTGVK